MISVLSLFNKTPHQLSHILIGFLLISFLPVNTQAQNSKIINANLTTEQIRVDGYLNEGAWAKASRIGNFIQREQKVGEPSTEKTETAILYDKNNLYIGVWCYQKISKVSVQNICSAILNMKLRIISRS